MNYKINKHLIDCKIAHIKVQALVYTYYFKNNVRMQNCRDIENETCSKMQNIHFSVMCVLSTGKCKNIRI